MFRLSQNRHLQLATCAVAGALVGSMLFLTSPALAITHDTEARVTEAQKTVEESAKRHNEAKERLEKANGELAKAQGKVDEANKRVEKATEERNAQRDKAAAGIRASYKLKSSNVSLVDLALAADDFNDYIAMVEALNAMEEYTTGEAVRLNELQEGLVKEQQSLADARDEVARLQSEAETAYNDAEKSLDEAMEARKAAQQAALDENLAKGWQADLPEVDWSLDREAFVEEWAPRIDAYLEGSPLGGHGKTFAEAAWDFGVDPRWSPAISNTESSQGRVCFKPFNAWGWGDESWPDWDTAIREHVAGLARGYGYSISPDAAKRYCPPHAEKWYHDTAAQMATI